MFRFINSNILILVFLSFFRPVPQFLLGRNHHFKLLVKLISINILEDGMKLRAILTGFRKTVMP